MLLRRSKSGDLGRGGKKAQAEQERQRQAAAAASAASASAASRPAPRLPEFPNSGEKLFKSFVQDRPSESAYGLFTGGPTAMYGRSSVDAPRFYAAAAAESQPPVPPMPPTMAASPTPRSEARAERTESMTHRGRYSYASSAVNAINSPRRVRRRKDPIPFNVLIVGACSVGKTSFLDFLKTALALPPKRRSAKAEDEADYQMPAPVSGNFVPHYLETELDGERVGLTLWDSEGLDKNLIDLQLRDLSAFVESKFEVTFSEEMKVVRSPAVQETHIHAVILILDPARVDRNIAASRKMSAGSKNGASRNPTAKTPVGLDKLDLDVLRLLHGKSTVIPVIGKADTVTMKHMNVLKKSIWESIKKAKLDPLEALGPDEEVESNPGRIDEEDEDEESGAEEEEDDEDDDDDDDGEGDDDKDEASSDAENGNDETSSSLASPTSKRFSTHSLRKKHKTQDEEAGEEAPLLPFSIISPDLYEPGVVGRQFPWGFADPYNEQHCDFPRLKEAIFNEWRHELRDVSRVKWYERWRTERLNQRSSTYHNPTATAAPPSGRKAKYAS